MTKLLPFNEIKDKYEPHKRDKRPKICLRFFFLLQVTIKFNELSMDHGNNLLDKR